MIKSISRRTFLTLLTTLPASGLLTTPLQAAKADFPQTVAVLKEAWRAESIASLHYRAFISQAMAENYPNIGYLFAALAVSESIHARNYLSILSGLSHEPAGLEMIPQVAKTRKNLLRAAEKEYEKITKVYPDFLKRLEPEAHERAVISCMYSWKCHQQHEEDIKEVKKYSRLFFSSVAEEIEGRSLDFHVCSVCGSTMDEAPTAPCEICNHPLNKYKRVERPAT